MNDEEFYFISSEPLPQAVADAIKRQLPLIDLQDIEDAADAYRMTPLLIEANSSKASRQSLRYVATHAANLSNTLATLHWVPRQVLNDKLIQTANMPQFKALRWYVEVLASLSQECVEQFSAKRGRPQTLRKKLITDLAEIIRNAGYPVDAKQDGALMYLTTEILQLCDGDASGARSLIRNSLGK